MAQHLNQPPYLIHTNRELGLMLKGLKPLARFTYFQDGFPAAVLRYLRLFDRHVRDGRFIRRDVVVSDPATRRLHYVYFALSGEEWRIQKMVDLLAGVDTWSRQHEREEGELLGYTHEQNDVWLSEYYTYPD